MIVNLLTAVGTVGAVIMALFGDHFKARLFPPVLSLKLLSEKGEKVQFGGSKGPEGRFYHLQLENLRRWSKATSAGLHMLRLERPGLGGAWVTEWAGDVQIRCRDQELFPLQRDVGGPIDFDVLSVWDGTPPELRLYPILAPNNLAQARSQSCEFMVWFRAKSSEADSDFLRLHVIWDGMWDRGETEMQAHLKVKVSSLPS